MHFCKLVNYSGEQSVGLDLTSEACAVVGMTVIQQKGSVTVWFVIPDWNQNAEFKLDDGSHTHTHTFNGPFSRTTQVSRYQKGKPIWILLKQETVSGNTISWATCKSAPPSRQITMPAPHHSVFTGQMPFLPPNQQCQSTGGTHGSHSASDKVAVKKICTCWLLTPQRNM